jgi:tetratricopeptide (TPR) repeat protein
MAQTKEDSNIDISERLGKAEKYVTEYKKSIGIIGGIVLGLILAYIGYRQFVVKPQEEDAQREMYVAELYFSKDSTKYAIEGDGSFPGFKTITDKYGSSKSGNLAQYYLGMSYLKQGQWQNAIDALEAYDAEDDITGALALGGIASSHLELGHTDEALNYFKKAADWDKNNFTRPVFLMKAAMIHEMKKDYSASLAIYNQIKTDYPLTTEARDIDKYISRAEAMGGK